MIKRFIFFCVAVTNILSFSSCEKEVDERLADELIRFKAYIRVLKRNNPGLQIDSTKSGMYYIIYNQGNGGTAQKDNYLLYDFTEQNLDQEVFKSTSKSISDLHDVYSTSVRYVPKFVKYKNEYSPLLAGVEEAFTLIKEGGKIRLFIPSNLAYGTSPSSYLGKVLNGFSSLIVDIEFKRLVTDVEAYENELVTKYLTENYQDSIANNDKYLSNVLDSLKNKGVYILHKEDKIVDDEGDNDDEEEEEDPYQPIVTDDEVELNYTGWLVDKWYFDTSVQSIAEEKGIYNSSREYKPINVKVGGTNYIEGFSLALKRLKTNTKAIVFISSAKAYGEVGQTSNGIESIPPISPLIFELDINGKTKTSGKD